MIDLSSYTGSTIKVRFYFDTLDELANGEEGWFIDDVVVTAPSADPAPEVTSITPAENSAIVTSSTSLQYVFSEAVSNVDATDLTLSGTAAAGATVTGVTGAGTTWTFAVSGLSTGTLTATLAKDALDITDATAQSLLPVVTKFLVALPDRFEANESLATARDLGSIGGTRTENNLTLHSTTDADFYKFTADASGTVTLNLSYDILQADVDFYAYDSNQALIVEPDPQDLDDVISLNVVKGQSYYIKVFSETQEISNNYGLQITAPFDAPRVTGVFVKGSGWSVDYLTFMGASLANSSTTYGYFIPTGSTQLQTLPWSNLNTVSIQFNEGMNLTKTQLQMVGTSVYNVAGSTFSYNATDRVATWQLPANLVADRLYVKLAGSGAGVVQDLAGIALDGEFTTSTSAFPSGNGTAGGDFIFRFDVLPGDSNGSGTINSTDITQVKTRSGPVLATNYRSDLNGSNAINSTDITIVKTRSGTVLPPAPLGLFSNRLVLSTARNLLA